MGRILQIIAGVVVAGFLVGAAPLPNDRAQAEHIKATQDLAKATEALARNVAEQSQPGETPLLERPCVPGEDSRDSDLCAQWKAADAARDAAKWTFWSTLVSGFAVFGVFLTLSQGRAALEKARAANITAAETLKHAQEQADRDLRPWLDFEFGNTLGHIQPDGLGFGFDLIVKNTGKEPAHNVRLTFHHFLYDPNINKPQTKEFDSFVKRVPPKKKSNVVIMPGGRFKPYAEMVHFQTEKFKILHAPLNMDIIDPAFIVCADYQWQDGKRSGRTVHAYRIRQTRDGQTFSITYPPTDPLTVGDVESSHVT